MYSVEHNGDLSVGQLEELQFDHSGIPHVVFHCPEQFDCPELAEVCRWADLQSAAKKVYLNGDWHCWRQQKFQNSYLKEREI